MVLQLLARVQLVGRFFFYGDDGGCKFIPDTGRGWDCREEAVLTLLLSGFRFPGPPWDTIQNSLFPMAISLAQGKKTLSGPTVSWPTIRASGLVTPLSQLLSV